MKAKCPTCSHEFEAAFVATVPDKQIFTLDITMQSEIISATVLGDIITSTSKLLEAVAKEIHSRVHVFIQSVQCEPQKVSITFLIAAVKVK